jgi:hypothetical protein
MQMLSTSTSIAVETVNDAHGQPVWYQLYAPREWEACVQLLSFPTPYSGQAFSK